LSRRQVSLPRLSLKSQDEIENCDGEQARGWSELLLVSPSVARYARELTSCGDQRSRHPGSSGRSPESLVLPILQLPQGRRPFAGLARIYGRNSELVARRQPRCLRSVSLYLAPPLRRGSRLETISIFTAMLTPSDRKMVRQ
jgi:hypothetical protein